MEPGAIIALAKIGVDPEDLYSLVLVSNPAATSDGTPLYIATTLQRDKYVSRVYAVRRGKSRLLAGGPEEGVRCIRPGPSGWVAAVYSGKKGGKPVSGILLIDPETGVGTKILEQEGKPIIDLRWAGEDRLVAAVLDRPEQWKPYEERDFLDIQRLPFWFNGVGWVFDRWTSLYLVEVPSGRAKRLTQEGVDAYPYSVTGDGWLVYALHRYEMSPMESDVVALNLRSGERRVLVRRMVVNHIAARDVCDHVAVRGHFRERGNASHSRVYIVDCERGKLSCASCDVDLSTMNTVNSDARGPSCQDPVQWLGDDLFFHLHSAGRVSVHKYTSGGTLVSAIEAGDSVVDEYCVSRKATVYTLMTSTAPNELYVSGQGRVTSWNRWLEERGLSKPLHHVVHRGDYGIDYWVLIPPGAEDCKRCIPWVLYIHGGPKSSFGHGFMFEFHALASKGYAVVYGNPRGSDGYSEEFADIRGRYGTDDYEDLMAIAKDAVRRYKQLSDSRRAVAGGSYGGWMTAYIATRTQMFRAAVAMRGCSNWTSFYGTSDIGWWFAEDQIGYRPWDEPQEYLRASPLFSVDKARTPTLIIHSTGDYRCPLEQALQLYTALRVVGVKTRLAVFPGETHDLMRSGTPRRRVARLKLILEWLSAHLAEKE